MTRREPELRGRGGFSKFIRELDSDTKKIITHLLFRYSTNNRIFLYWASQGKHHTQKSSDFDA